MMKNKLKLNILIYSSEYWPFYQNVKELMNQKGHNLDCYIFSQEKNSFKYIREIFKLFLNNFQKYDLIHAYFGTSGLIANFQRKIPVITTYCGSDLLGVSNNNYEYNYLKSLIFRFSSKLAYKFSIQTTTISKILEQQLPGNLKNHIIPLGVDTDHFQPISQFEARDKLGWAQDEHYILFPAEKNRSIKRFHIAQEIVRKLKLKANLISLDEKNMYTKLPLFYSAANLLIFVSKHEGSPNVIREALSCNLPIFSFDVGDVREQIEGVSHSHCVTIDNKKEIQKLIEKYLTFNKNSRSNGRDKIINYNWSNYVDNLIRLYEFNVKK